MKHIQGLILPVINMHALLFYTNLHGVHLVSSIAILKTCLSVERELLDILLLQVQLKRIIRDNKTWGEENTGIKAESYFLLTFILVLLTIIYFFSLVDCENSFINGSHDLTKINYYYEQSGGYNNHNYLL